MSEQLLNSECENKLRLSSKSVAQMIRTTRGLSFSRLPAWTYEQFQPNSNIVKMAERLSGARFEIETTATEISFQYRSLDRKSVV
jgi:hypothetical protein